MSDDLAASSKASETGVKERRRSRRVAEAGQAEATSESSSLSSGDSDSARPGVSEVDTQQHGGVTSTDGSSSSQESLSLVKDSGRDDGEEKTRKPNYEFGGPIGAFFTMISLPLVILALYSACSPQTCSIQDVFKTKIPSASSMFSLKALLVVLGWLAFNILLYFLPIGGVSPPPPPLSRRLTKPAGKCKPPFIILQYYAY